MSNINIYMDGQNARPQQNRRQDNRRRMPCETRCPVRDVEYCRPYLVPQQYVEIPRKKGWAEVWGEANSTLDCRDPNFG
ncbi:MAG TPA: hypothetical protein O0X27_06620 [Methanocorpusculum sp.]|nr:hypothetical protein [Methanocorpusculum sp.]